MGSKEQLHVPLSELRKNISLDDVAIPPFDGLQIIGQHRAVQGIDRFIRLNGVGRNDFNLYVAGIESLEGMQPLLARLRAKRDTNTTPNDAIMVHNYDGEEFRIIEVPAGEAKPLQSGIETLLNTVLNEYVTTYDKQRSEVLDKHEKEFNDRYKKLFAKELADLDLKVTDTFTTGVISYDNKESALRRLEKDTFRLHTTCNTKDPDKSHDQQLKERFKDLEYKKKYESFKEKMRQQLLTEVRKAHFLVDDYKIRETMKKTARTVIEKKFDTFFKEHTLAKAIADPDSALGKYTTWLKDNVVSRIHAIAYPSSDARVVFSLGAEKEYRVNVLRDNTTLEGQPVIAAEDHRWEELFAEYEGGGSGLISALLAARSDGDHSKYKAGDYFKAHGGYLVLDAIELIHSGGFTDMLKFVEKGTMDFDSQLVKRKKVPEAAEVSTRVVLYGSTNLWHALMTLVPSFSNVFKSSAQVVSQQEVDDTLLTYAGFVSEYAQNTAGVLPIATDGLEAVLEEAVRHAGKKNKIAADKAFYRDLVRLASSIAQEAGNNTISADDVRAAIAEDEHIHGLYSDLSKEAILEDTIAAAVDGAVVGQVNGLAVSGLIRYTGKPLRITTKVSVGSEGIYNIDQKIGKTGPSHKKSMAILKNILAGDVAHSDTIPLVFSAAVTFEQNYGGVDGDSATVSQFISLVSALSDIPIQQGYAITGSADQFGNVQAIGGVNEKIEGFYEICKEKGTGGEYAAIIPTSNIRHLMLRKDVVEAVENKEFSVYAVDNIYQACSLAMDTPWEKIYEKVVDKVKTLGAAIKEAGITTTPESESTPAEQEESLESLLHNPSKLGVLATQYGLDTLASADGTPIHLQPELKLAIAYDIHARHHGK